MSISSKDRPQNFTAGASPALTRSSPRSKKFFGVVYAGALAAAALSIDADLDTLMQPHPVESAPLDSPAGRPIFPGLCARSRLPI
jgi:hypothetical protein